MADKKKALLIVNPCSGKDKTRAEAMDIVDKFSKDDYEISVHPTKCQGDATNIVKEELEDNDLIVCCGGDGTLFDVVNGAAEYENAAVGVIPFGSGNDFIKSFEFSERFSDIAAQIRGCVTKIDLIKFEDMYSCNVCSMGLDAEVVAHKSRRKLLSRISGPLAYYVSIFTAFVFNLKNSFTVVVDDALTVTYSPMNYIVRKGANGSDTLKALLKAMYNYYLAAEAYTA